MNNEFYRVLKEITEWVKTKFRRIEIMLTSANRTKHRENVNQVSLQLLEAESGLKSGSKNRFSSNCRHLTKRKSRNFGKFNRRSLRA